MRVERKNKKENKKRKRCGREHKRNVLRKKEPQLLRFVSSRKAVLNCEKKEGERGTVSRII